ncbi:MAG: 2Fe-2S iron-sulfur cluster binding domain-containing protein [Rubrivivax sp.]|jgi:2Fe-2S ferredoxin|nr:2Fe-2S iron-sulfur cluster binding domain-containing protein [Rubrivivax sp.]
MTLTVHLHEIRANGERVDHAVPARAGQSLMQAAIEANVSGISADCGGLMTCATCHVYVHDDWAERVPPAGDEEVGMLDFVAAERRATSRLSCQITLTDALDGLAADLPPTQY